MKYKLNLLAFFFLCFQNTAAYSSSITRVIKPERHATAYTLLDMLPLSQFTTIVDLGCGKGDVAAFIARNTAASVIGIDISHECIETAQVSFSLPNLSYAVMNIDQWQLPTEQFDLITSFHTLHWAHNFQKAIVNCARSLKPNGILAVTTAHTDHFLYKSIIATVQSTRWKGYFASSDLKPWHCYDQNSIVSALKQAGLEPVCIEVWHKEIVSESRDEFIAWVQSWLEPIAYFCELPKTLHRQFLEDIVDHFLSTILIQDDGSFSFMTPLLVFCAQKNPEVFPHSINQYNDVVVDLSQYSLLKPEIFKEVLDYSCTHWKAEGRKTIWLTLPLERGELIPVALQQNFVCHHAIHDRIVLTRLLIEGLENMIPHYATRTVGVAGLVIDEHNNVLVVKDRYKEGTGFKLPGGGVDQGEDIWHGAVREIKEETGIDTEFVGIITWREHHKQKWGCSDIYFACLLRPLNFEIHMQESEIEACCWMPYDQFKHIARDSCLEFLTAYETYGAPFTFKQIDETRTLYAFQ